MSKKSDDSIERIFRQALTQYDTTFQQNDWLKMEKMLDDEAVRRGLVRSKRIKGIGYVVTGLTVLFIAVYFLAFNPSDPAARLNRPATEMRAEDDLNSKGNVKREKPSDGLLSLADSASSKTRGQNEVATDKSNSNSAGGVQPSVSALPIEKEDQKEPGSSLRERKKSGQEAVDQNTIPDKKDLAKRNAEQDQQSPQTAIDKSLPAKDLPGLRKNTEKSRVEGSRKEKGAQFSQTKPQDFASPDEDQPVNKTTPDNTIQQPENTTGNMIVEKDEQISQDVKSVSGEDINQLKDSVSQKITSEPVVTQPSSSAGETNAVTSSSIQQGKKDSLSLVSADSLAKHTSPQDSMKQELKIDSSEKEKLKPVSRVSIGIVFAPEFSTTRLSHYSTPGESMGLRIGYQLSNRFHINTGIIRSTKKYKDSASEYSPNPNYWNIRTNGVIPEEIDSKCLVYEIPLDIQFNLVESPKSRLFLSTGISSYLMVSQAYHYNFEQPNPGADTSWGTSSTEKYWFGVGMLSAGYERYLSRSLALGIEPYLKTSLTEIGWPNIKLFSAGAYVTFRYRFITKNH